MQADTYGYRFVMESGPRVHSPCIGWWTVSQMALLFALVMLFAARAQAANWVTVKSAGGTGFGLSYTIEIQVDTDATTPTTQSVRMNITAAGTPAPGSGPAYVQYAAWASAIGGTYIGGANITTFPTIATGAPSTVSNGSIRSLEASIQNSGPAVGYASVSWTVVNDIRVKKAKVSYFNQRDTPIQIKIVDAANPATVISTETIAARSGFIKTYTLPSGVDDVKVLELIDGFAKDGPSWVEAAGHTEEVEVTDAISGELVMPDAEPTAVEVPQSADLPQPAPNPNAQTGTPGVTVVIMPSSQTPWKARTDLPAPTPGVTSDFTTSAYREGVDKLAKLMEGDAQTVPVALATPTSQIAAANVSGYNSKSYSKLPTAPTLGALGSASTVTISFEVPKMEGGNIVVSKTIDFSAAPYSGPIAVFRGVLVVLLTLTYYLLTFFTVRSAFAGK